MLLEPVLSALISSIVKRVRVVNLLIIPLMLIGGGTVVQARGPETSRLQGSWSGAIGPFPVRMCMMQNGHGDINGAYYYMNHRVPISLHGSGTDLLLEGARRSNGPQWHIVSLPDGEIHGYWRGGAKGLPIMLRKEPVSPDDEPDSPCTSHAFFAPLIDRIQWHDTPMHFGAISYVRRVLAAPPGLAQAVSINVVQLDGSRPGDRQINTSLLGGQKPWGEDGWAGCLGSALDYTGGLGDYDHSEEPILLSTTIVSLRVSDGSYCGGLHPNAASSYAEFERDTGRAVDIRTWFRADAIAQSSVEATGAASGYQVLPMAPLRKAIVAHIPTVERECLQYLADDDGVAWWVGLSPTGFVFAPDVPHVMQSCEIEVVLPLAEVAKFLTPQADAAASTAMH